MDYSNYDLIADLFDYPQKGYFEKITKVHDFLEKTNPKAASHIKFFLNLIPKDHLDEIQELFTRSFDVQSITTLDVGYVLFGDDYKRGELLANLTREHRDAGIDTGIELADHLPNMLRLIAKMQDQELMRELVREIIFPALKKMIKEFDPDRLQIKKKSYKKHYKTLIDVSKTRETAYLNCLRALDQMFSRDFVLGEKLRSKPSSEFLRSVVNEMEIENQAQG